MATKYINTKLTLLDRAKRTAEGRRVLPILSVMNELVDDFFMDVPFVACNMGLLHKVVRDTGMVDSTNRSLYQGVKPSKRNVQPVYEHIIQKARRREIDPDELHGMDDPKEYLRQEDEGHIRKLGEDIVYEMINGVETDGSEYCKGLLARLDALNPTGLNNVMSNGGADATNNTSVLVVEWNPAKGAGAYGLYPTGFASNGPFGIEAKDLGEVTGADEDDSTAKLELLTARFKAYAGLAVGNNRKIARLANVNSSAWDNANSFVNGGTERLVQLLHACRFDRSRTRIYVNTTVAAQMDIYALNKTNTLWPTSDVFGRPVKMFEGMPVRELDTTIISNAQSVVS
jgi:hypothetical protein